MPIVRRQPVEVYRPIPSEVIRALIQAREPDHITKFKCHVCYYSRTAREHCKWCDGHGIMNRFQYMSFGRTVVPDNLARNCALAERMGVRIPDRFKSEYDACKPPPQVRHREPPKGTAGAPLRLFTRRN